MRFECEMAVYTVWPPLRPRKTVPSEAVSSAEGTLAVLGVIAGIGASGSGHAGRADLAKGHLHVVFGETVLMSPTVLFPRQISRSIPLARSSGIWRPASEFHEH